MHRFSCALFAPLTVLALSAAMPVARAQAPAPAPLDDTALTQRGNTVLAASVGYAMLDVGVTEFDLPDLDSADDIANTPDNIRAVAVIFYASALEDLKVFTVADRIAESFKSGKLPIGRDKAGAELEAYLKGRDLRLTERDRRALYAVSLGIGGTELAQPNRDFEPLWLRFLASISALQRQQRLDGVLDGGAPKPSLDNLRKVGRDLATNLGRHGYGGTRYAAVDLQNQIRQIQRMLSSKEVLDAYGAKDMWQVVDKVASQSLGGAQNSKKYRTLAGDGAMLVLWIARYAALFDPKNDPTGTKLVKALEDPQVAPIASAERWLGASGKTGAGPASARSAAKPSLLCLDAKRRLVRCRLRSAKRRAK